MKDDDTKDHGEPPQFAKWLIWLFKPTTWKKQPIIACVATVIALFTAYSGFKLLFNNSGESSAAAAGNEIVTPAKTHDVQVTDIRFLNTDPKGEVAPAPMFNRIQLTFTNKGTSTSVVTKCSINIIDSWFVSPVTGVAAKIEPSATFRIYVPPSLDPGPYTTAESFLFNLAPDETESIEIIVDYPLPDESAAPENNSTIWPQKDKTAFLGSPVFLEPILLAHFELQLDSEDVVESVPFCFTLPGTAIFGIGNRTLDDPMAWLEANAKSRIGGLPVVKSVAKLNLSKADKIKDAAELRSPSVNSFLSLIDKLRPIEDQLD